MLASLEPVIRWVTVSPHDTSVKRGSQEEPDRKGPRTGSAAADGNAHDRSAETYPTSIGSPWFAVGMRGCKPTGDKTANGRQDEKPQHAADAFFGDMSEDDKPGVLLLVS
jgi:hypothetical protein